MNENKEISSQIKNWNKIIRKIWDDPTKKEQLLQNPQKTLRENGINISDSTEIHIHENSESERHFVLPQKPSKELSDEFLSHIVAGFHYLSD